MAFIENITISDFCIALKNTLWSALNRAIYVENNGGRIRVVLDAGPGAQTLGTVSSVPSVYGLTTFAAAPMRDIVVTPQEKMSWSLNVRGRIS